MIRSTTILAAFVCALFALPALAEEKALGVWHFFEPGDILYSEGLDAAGVVLEDSRFALMILQPDSDGALIGASVFANAHADSIKSVLEMTDGSLKTLVVSGDKLNKGGNPEEGAAIYSFFIVDGDVALFKAARSWRVETPEGTTTFPLKGSRRAITTAESARDLRGAGPEVMQSWIDACDAAAAHPFDASAPGPGVKWADIVADAAVTACNNAIIADANIPRIRYQLGRAYDKAKDARALDLIRRAAQEDGYPAAWNHLGVLHWDGDYVGQNLQQAREMFTKGSDLGNLPARYNLARMMVLHGDGVTDANMGRSLLQGVADMGYPLAQRAYGQWLADGTFGAADPAGAVTYLSQAADGGDGVAAYTLAKLYEGGNGLEADARLHLKYLKIAARAGHEDAKAALSLE